MTSKDPETRPGPIGFRAAGVDLGVEHAVHVDLDLVAERPLLVLADDVEGLTGADVAVEHVVIRALLRDPDIGIRAAR